MNPKDAIAVSSFQFVLADPCHAWASYANLPTSSQYQFCPSKERDGRKRKAAEASGCRSRPLGPKPDTAGPALLTCANRPGQDAWSKDICAQRLSWRRQVQRVSWTHAFSRFFATGDGIRVIWGGRLRVPWETRRFCPELAFGADPPSSPAARSAGRLATVARAGPHGHR